MSLFLLDNYDSFTHNLLHLLQQVYPHPVTVARPGSYALKDLESFEFLVISPGPGRPETTSWAMDLIQRYYREKPILGVCLGMQCLNAFFGGKTVESGLPVHGKTDQLVHEGTGMFSGLQSPLQIARYHSLICTEIQDCFTVSGSNPGGIPMAIHHKQYPLAGVQFHPESFLTPYGSRIIDAFIRSKGDFNG